MDTLVGRLVGRAVRDQDTIGTAAVKEMLNAAYANDIKKGLMASDRTSLTRHFAALVLESHGGKALEAVDKFRADLEAAGDNAELKAAAIRTFAVAFAKAQANVLQMVFSNLLMAGNPKKSSPSTFASAITDILFDNFNAVQKAVGVDGLAIYNDARGVVTNELHVKVGFFDGDLVVDTIKADARHEGGDKSYTIDIGV